MVQNENGEVIMSPTMTPSTVKMIGANGQISLGKKYAGRQVLVEEHAPGVPGPARHLVEFAGDMAPHRLPRPPWRGVAMPHQRLQPTAGYGGLPLLAPLGSRKVLRYLKK